MYCSKCGKEIRNKSRFCVYCGEKIGTDNIETVQDVVSRDEKTNVAVNKRKTRLWITWILVSIFIIGILTYVITIIGDKKSEIKGRYYQVFEGRLTDYYIDFKGNGIAEADNGMKLLYKQTGDILEISEASYGEEIIYYECIDGVLYCTEYPEKAYYPEDMIENMEEFETYESDRIEDDTNLNNTYTSLSESEELKDNESIVEEMETPISAEERALQEKLERKQNILDKLSDFEMNEDYKGGILYIKQDVVDMQNDKDIKDVLNYLLAKYKEQVIMEAAVANENGTTPDAETILKEAKHLLDGDEDIEQLLLEYSKSRSLASIDIFSCNDLGTDQYIINGARISTEDDWFGNVYENCLYLVAQGVETTFFLDNKYKALEACIAYDSYGKDQVVMDLKIYADDVLVYENNNIDCKTEPFNIHVDIQNCKFLKFVRTDNHSGGGYLIVGEPMLLKS